MLKLKVKLPYSIDCPNQEKVGVEDHVDCEQCNWEESCEDCGGFNDGDETRCQLCELNRQIYAADMACDIAQGK
jgi:hypothetical protein